MKNLTRITFDPSIMGGKPCIRGMRVTVGTLVGLLVDESGSMGERAKIEVARKTAVLFRDSLAEISNVDLYIYGHTADVDHPSTLIYRYWKPGARHPASLGSMTSRRLAS